MIVNLLLALISFFGGSGSSFQYGILPFVSELHTRVQKSPRAIIGNTFFCMRIENKKQFIISNAVPSGMNTRSRKTFSTVGVFFS